MKKKLLTITALLAALTFFNIKASAQAVSDPVTVNITLSDAFSIVLEATPTVTFTYADAAAYATSQTVLKSDHFSIISNKPYSIAVKANSVFNTILTTTPPLSAVQISVDATTVTTGATYTTATLSTTNQTIAAAASPTIGTAYNINYAIPTGAPLLAMSAGTYTTNVVYTVTQP